MIFAWVSLYAYMPVGLSRVRSTVWFGSTWIADGVKVNWRVIVTVMFAPASARTAGSAASAEDVAGARPTAARGARARTGRGGHPPHRVVADAAELRAVDLEVPRLHGLEPVHVRRAREGVDLQTEIGDVEGMRDVLGDEEDLDRLPGLHAELRRRVRPHTRPVQDVELPLELARDDVHGDVGVLGDRVRDREGLERRDPHDEEDEGGDDRPSSLEPRIVG